jgi:phage terminase small subunit
MAINTKQQRFAEEYLIDLNATQAAIRAGYSEKTAGQIGEQLLKKLEIAEAIRVGLAKRSERTQITADMVLKELATLGLSKMTDFATWNNGAVVIKNSDDLSDDAAKCVSEVSETKTKDGGTVKFKLYDKVGALDKVARHLGMYVDRQELTGLDGGAIQHELVSVIERVIKAPDETDD